MGTIFIALLALFFGCEQTSQPRQPSMNSGETSSNDENTESQDNTDPKRYNLVPFNYNAYPEQSSTGKGYAIEYGYIDMRELKGSNTSEPFDYRWHRMGARAGKDVLKEKYKLGCALMEDKKIASDKNIAELKISGAVMATAKLKDNYFKYSEKGDFDSDYSQPLEVSFVSDDEQKAKFEATTLPTQGSIQIVGEYTGTISSGMVLTELNTALNVATEDFKLADIGTGEGYNLVIVDFYGSQKSPAKHLRCYLEVEERATIPIELFKSLAPIKVAIGLFVNLVQEDEYWSASIIGSGVEDVSFE